MMNISVEMTFANAPGRTDEEFEAFLDEVIVQLDRIGREVNLAARIADRTADFATTIEADRFEDAVVAFLPDIRTALHAAGCSTPGWPCFTPQSHVARDLQDAA